MKVTIIAKNKSTPEKKKDFMKILDCFDLVFAVQKPVHFAPQTQSAIFFNYILLC
jgi:hypothetical protein